MAIYISPTVKNGDRIASWLSWCMIASVTWISKPIEIPIALLSPIMLAVITLINSTKLNWPYRYSLFFLFSLFFLLTHYYLDHIDGEQLGWQLMRLSLPILGLTLFACNWKSLDAHSKRIFCKNALVGSVIVLGLEAIARVVAYPSLAIGSIVGDLSALYEFKSASFLFIDGNICAYISTYLLCYSIITKLNTKYYNATTNAETFCHAALILIIYLSFSRQAWFTALSSIAIYFGYTITEKKFPRLVHRLDSPLVMCALIFGTLIIFSFSPEEMTAKFGEINNDSFGSASTKFAIATYTAIFIAEASVLDIIIGIGPQNVIDKNVVSYVGHSLIGLFPEFGLTIILLVFLWLRKIRGGIILLPLLIGSTFSLYPFAYLLPVYILHSTLPPSE